MSASLLASASFSAKIEKNSQNCDKNRSKKIRNNGSKKVVTFSPAGIFTVPNELGSNANKLFDHGLSKKNRERKYRYEKNMKAQKEVNRGNIDTSRKVKNLHHLRANEKSYPIEGQAR